MTVLFKRITYDGLDRLLQVQVVWMSWEGRIRKLVWHFIAMNNPCLCKASMMFFVLYHFLYNDDTAAPVWRCTRYLHTFYIYFRPT